MGNFVLAYKGGGGMAATEEERAAAMAEWGAWFGSLGTAVVEAGAPFSASATVASDKSVGNGGTLTGYSVLSADSLDGAVSLAKSCPIFSSGGSVEVYEAMEM
jgi:hypothetical protein